MVLDAPVLGGMRFGSVLVLSWCFWRCSMVCRARCATYRVMPDTHVLRGVLRALGILPGYPTFAQFCTESVLYLRFSPLKKYAKLFWESPPGVVLASWSRRPCRRGCPGRGARMLSWDPGSRGCSSDDLLVFSGWSLGGLSAGVLVSIDSKGSSIIGLCAIRSSTNALNGGAAIFPIPEVAGASRPAQSWG